ncbi:helicase-related protein [Salinigranum halophilum]|uniref:helicase-related protein n=1 Tax=Salinigranum halophilum TaxID=2565931 RepID=UPI0013755F88|nr:helicase-related protein [Salinigranum halophilum]
MNKYDSLRQVLSGLDDPAHTLVYTNGDQLRTVQTILDDAGVRQHKVTEAEGMEQRRALLDQFARRDLHALVGIDCLDEGVDVKPANTAILMSNSGNEREFIQRRGRVLRQHDTKARASVYDMVVIPPRGLLDDLLPSHQRLLERELDRVEAFATSAENGDEARQTVKAVRDALDASQDES